MARSALLVANPHSGRGTSLAIAHALSGLALRFGYEAEIILGSTASHTRQILAEKFSKKTDLVVAIGGDGLFNLTLQELAQIRVPLYVVPAGTGNDFARSSGSLSTDANEIWERISGIEPELIDLALVNGKQWFGQIMSTGFDSLVNKRANEMTLIKGSWKYNLATLFELPKFKALDYEINIDGREINTRAMMVTIGNGVSYGGGMKILPHANRRDGLLNIMIINPVSKIELLKVFPKVFDGSHVSHPALDFYTGKEIVIRSKALAYADGEALDVGALKIQVMPASLLTWTSS
jgi:diacylglycerol kinase (ATP)